MRRSALLLACFLTMLLPGVLQAQLHPRLTVLTPPGGQAGTSVKVTLTGTDLDDVTALQIAPAGLTATRVEDPAKKGQFLPNQFEIKIPAATSPGTFDLRAVCSWGITNPRAFQVGELPESLEKEPNNDVPQAQSLPLNSTVSGVVAAPNDVDYYSVACKQGEQVIISVATDSIDSRLDADLRVFAASGRLLAANRPRSTPNAMCSFVAPAAGTYFVRICSHAHIEGNAECFYRLSASTRPWIDAVYPPLVEPGKAAPATLWGRNLPGAATDPTWKNGVTPLQRLGITLAPPTFPRADQQLASYEWLPPPRSGLDGYFFRLKNAAGWSNSVPILYAQGPIVAEASDNDTAAKAQNVPLPCEIVGHIEKRGDRDWFAFAGKAGEVVILEGFAERLGTPADLYFEMYRGDNQALLGEFDDHPDQPTFHRFYSRTDDPCTRFTLPTTGKFLVMVSSRDATLRGDPRLIYRLSLHAPKPDFRVVAVDALPQNPSVLCLHPGGRQHCDVVIFRRDGFSGPVTLTVEGLPPGVTCPPQLIAAGVNVGSLVFSAADKLADYSGTFLIKASATINGQPATRDARYACLVWPNANEQNNSPGISRLCHSLSLAVRQNPPPFRATILTDKPVLPAGGNTPVKVKIERLWPDAKQPIVLTALHVPPGVTFNNNQPLTVAADKAEVEAKLQTPANLAAETFPLVLRATSQIPYNKDPKAKQKPNTPMVETSLPVLVGVYKRIADITLPGETISLKPGAEHKVQLKITRLHGFQGPLQVQAQGLPAGVTLAGVTIPEKASEATLVFKAAAKAALVKTVAVTIRVTGTVAPVNLTSEGKLTIGVSK